MNWITYHDKWQWELVLASHVARVEILLDEDASINSLEDADDEHHNGQGIWKTLGEILYVFSMVDEINAFTWGYSIINNDEAGESKAGPGHDKGPRGLKEEAKVCPICSEPPLFEDGFRCLSVLGRYSKS